MKRSIDWPVATDSPRSPGRIKHRVEDFFVHEETRDYASGFGEHLQLLVRKVNLTTVQVQRRIAKAFHVPSRQVSYVGIKDKSCVATQYFSIHLPQAPDSTEVPGIDVLSRHRHVRKLTEDDMNCNCFEITVRDVVPELVAMDRLNKVPNYFGEQRFGRNGDNVDAALKWVEQGKPRISRFLRGMYISSMRSYVFNQVLGARVKLGTWQQIIDGDLETHLGTPTGPLWGRGRSPATGLAGSIESTALADDAEVLDALEWIGLDQWRRDFVLTTRDLSCELDGTTAHLKFILNPGCYATAVLRECFDYVTGPG